MGLSSRSPSAKTLSRWILSNSIAIEYHPFLVVALVPVPTTLSSSASGFLSEYKILVASALLSPFLKVLVMGRGQPAGWRV